MLRKPLKSMFFFFAQLGATEIKNNDSFGWLLSRPGVLPSSAQVAGP